MNGVMVVKESNGVFNIYVDGVFTSATVKESFALELAIKYLSQKLGKV